MTVPDLVLDPSLRNWVLFPILFVMILVGLIRHYATILLQPAPKPGDVKSIRQQQQLAYGTNLTNNASVIPLDAFYARQPGLIENFKEGKYIADPEASSASAGGMDMMTNPKMMESTMAMMKGQIMMVVPQTIMMGWINAFFAGFVLMRLPFPLTLRFKSMLQSGVMTKDLDVRWVSSLSWYFLNLLGLQSVYTLILGGNNQAGGMAAMGGGANPAMMNFQQPGTDYKKLFATGAENLQLVKHDYLLDGIEARILKKFK